MNTIQAKVFLLLLCVSCLSATDDSKQQRQQQFPPSVLGLDDPVVKYDELDNHIGQANETGPANKTGANLRGHMQTQSDPIWNSLEIAKLIASVLTPISVVVFGFWINRRLKVFEHLQWANQKVVEKRLYVYQELVPLLNDLLCYFTYVGNWKTHNPASIIELKRKLDRIAYEAFE